MRGEPWTEEQDKLLIKLCGKKSPEEIAEIMGRSPSAIKRRCSTIGVSRMRADRLSQIWSDEEVQEMLRLRSKGFTTRYIAHKLGRAIESVQGKLYNMKKSQVGKAKCSESETLWDSVSLMGLRVPLNEIASVLR